MSQQFHSFVYTPKNNTLILEDVCSPMFIVALFTIARYRSDLSVHQQVSGWRDVVCVYYGITLSYRKEWNFAICSNMDGPGGNMLSEISQTGTNKYYFPYLQVWVYVDKSSDEFSPSHWDIMFNS